MMQVVRDFDYLVVGSEHEALVLERNLIAQYHPYFNVDFKDDKSYPFIAITEDDVFPAIKYTREHHRKGTRYFGPYTDSRAARETIDTHQAVISPADRGLALALAGDPQGAVQLLELRFAPRLDVELKHDRDHRSSWAGGGWGDDPTLSRCDLATDAGVA